MSNKLVVILGPTASGKSALAIKLARKFNGEIVCADSRQIYKDMNIATAKTPRAALGVTNHLIDIVKPNQVFSAAQYQKLAIKTIKNIQKQDKIPFLVGGTGLYIKAVVDNLQIPKVKPNKVLRQRLEKQTEEQLFEALKKFDPQAAKIIDAKNKRRLVRALEVCLAGKKFSQKNKGKPLFDVLQIGLEISKKKLRQNIEKRIKQMFKQGLEKEVGGLVGKYGWTSILKNTIGYAEFRGSNLLLSGGRPLQLEKTFIEVFKRSVPRGMTTSKLISNRIKVHTCQFAKRQLTWFKKDKRIEWVRTQRQAEQRIKTFLKSKCFFSNT